MKHVWWIFVLLAGHAGAVPLTVSQDARDLVADDQAVFFNGATPWHILARLDREESIAYLDARLEDGFNALMFALVVNDGYHVDSFDNAYGDPPFTSENDFSTPNEAWFEHADWFMDQATQRGFWLLVLPSYIGYECGPEGFCDAIQDNGVDVMRDYGRFVGRRYGQYENILWVHGGDADAAAYGALDEVEAVMEGISETTVEQLQTAHCGRSNSAADCYDRPWLQVNNTYSECQHTPAELRGDWERSPVRPYFYIEGRYENENADDICLRSQAYWSLLGGAMGHFFGNRPMWDFWSGWQDALESSGSASMRHFGRLARSRDHASLIPDWDHQLLTEGFGSPTDGSYAAAARTADGVTAIVYTPAQRALTVDLSEIAGEDAAVWWFNPTDGNATFVSNLPTDGVQEFNPPSPGDWVLVLDAAQAELPAPGEPRDPERPSFGFLKHRWDDPDE